MNKRCRGTDIIEPHDVDVGCFSPCSSTSDKLRTQCRSCRSLEEKARQLLKRDEILEKKKNKHAALSRDEKKAKMLKKDFGMTLEAFNLLLAAQHGRCANPGCGNGIVGTGGARGYDLAFVDHDHKNDKVRGLLCAACNFALGQLRDDPRCIRGLAEYLETPTATWDKMRVSPEAMKQLLALIRNPPPPTQALIDAVKNKAL